MDRAINKETRKLISAFEIFKNGSYQNLDKGEWIAPKDSIYNWEELENKEEPVHYVKMGKCKYKSGKEGLRVPHFAIYPGSKAKTVEESPIHKLLKNWLFNRLKEMDLGKIMIEEEEIKLYPQVRKRLDKEGILHNFEGR